MANENWVSGVSGDWTNAADWGGTTPDGTGANATIAAAGSYTVTLSASDSITINSATLDATAATLDVTGLLDLGGTSGGVTDLLLLDAGVLEIAGTLENGTLNAAGGNVSIVNGATLDNITYIGKFSLSGTDSSIFASNLEVESGSTKPGTIVLEFDQGITFQGAETLNNVLVKLGAAGPNEDYSFLHVDTALTIGSDTTIVSNGDYGNGIASLDGATIVNDGLINVASGDFAIDPKTFINDGTIDVGGTGQALLETYQDHFVNDGVINVDANSFFQFYPDKYSGTGSMNIAGTLALNNYVTQAELLNVSFSAGALVQDNLNGTLDLGGGTLSLKGAPLVEVTNYATIANGTINPSLESVSLSFGVLENITWLGVLNPADTGGYDFSVAGSLTVLGTNGAPGTIDLTGYQQGIDFENSSTLNNVVVNLGASTGTAGYDELVGSSGLLSFGSGAEINSSAPTFKVENELDAPTIVNAGTINVESGQFSLFTTLFVNQGLIAVDAKATLNIDGTLGGSGLAEGVGQGVSHVDYLSATAGLANGTLSGAGFGAASKDTLALNLNSTGAITTDDTLLVLDGKHSEIEMVNSTGTVTGTLEATLGTIGTGGTLELLDNRGYAADRSFTVAGGTVVLGNGVFSAPALDLANAASRFTGFGTIAANVTNAGTIEAAGGQLDLTGSVSGTGVLLIDATDKLELGGSTSEEVIFGSGGKSKLELGAPAAFTGTLGGLSNGDVIDILGTMVSSATLSGASLLVTLSTGTKLDYALTGPLAGGSVKVVSDNHGGSDIQIHVKAADFSTMQFVAGSGAEKEAAAGGVAPSDLQDAVADFPQPFAAGPGGVKAMDSVQSSIGLTERLDMRPPHWQALIAIHH